MEPVKTSTLSVELTYPTLDFLDESKHYNTNALVKEINRLIKAIYDLERLRKD